MAVEVGTEVSVDSRIDWNTAFHFQEADPACGGPLK
jgi:hypothetical protein